MTLAIDWAKEDLVLSRQRVAEIFKFKNERAVTRATRLRRFPAPLYTHPQRWSRADLERHCTGGQGFGKARRSA